ncbi:hypothetical protein ACTFIV_001266 [Dictyostelium citrinum]
MHYYKYNDNDFEIQKIIKENNVVKVKYKNSIKINNYEIDTCIIKKIKNDEYKVGSCIFNEPKVLEKLKKLNNIVKCYGWYKDQEFTYFYLEYINGITLDEYIKNKESSLSDKEISLVCFEILKIIQSIHRVGVIHRDLKPENIMFNYDKNIWMLIDFGLSFSFTPIEDGSKCYTSVGSNGFKPPEIILRKEACRKSDVWSFGCIVIKMLGGELLDEENGEETELNYQISIQNKIPSHASKFCKNFIKKCLFEEPILRFDSEILNSHPFITKYSNSSNGKILELIERDTKKWIDETQKKKNIKIGDKSFTFEDENNTKEFNFKSIPDGTVELVFKKTFNKPIPDGSIPESVKIIDFGFNGESDFNQILTEDNLPNQLISLTLGNSFTYSIPYLKLIFLSLGKGACALKRLPNTLETLKYYGSIQDDLKENNIPFVKNLLIPFNNGPIFGDIIPNSVSFLTLGFFKDIETIETLKKLPKSVNDLVFTCPNDVFNQIQIKHLPSFITILVINRQIIDLENNHSPENFIKNHIIINN